MTHSEKRDSWYIMVKETANTLKKRDSWYTRKRETVDKHKKTDSWYIVKSETVDTQWQERQLIHCETRDSWYTMKIQTDYNLKGVCLKCSDS